MLQSIKNFFNKNQKDLPDLALVALYITPVCMTSTNETTYVWMFIAFVFFVAGWIFAILKKIIGILISLVVLWTVAYISTITEWDDYGYGIGTLVLIPNLLYWLCSKHGFKKLLKESKTKKG